jgi:hypothetical protein
MPGSCRESGGGYKTREGKKPASTCETLQLPASARRWQRPASRSQELSDDLPYLDRPLLPLTVALPAEKWRHPRRADLMRGLLTASPPALSRSS